MKKKILLIMISVCGFIVMPATVTAETRNLEINNSLNENSVYSDIYVWRYKIIDDVLYKRLYNTSTQTWVGDWIPA